MSRHTPDMHDPLAERLRHEDLETRPPFSAALHERVSQAIAAQDAEPAALFPRPAATARRPGFRWAAAVACTLLIAAGTGWWWLERSSPLDHREGEVAGNGGHPPRQQTLESDDMPVELVAVRRLTTKAIRRLDVLNQLAMLEPNPKVLFYDDLRRAANAMFVRASDDLTPADDPSPGAPSKNCP
jgi:hypothetical protein